MTDAVQRAMKADYVKILGENKKMKQKIANLEKELSLSKLAKKFDLFEELENYAEIYCNHKKQFFHSALFDSIACFLLLKRVSEKINLSKLLIWAS